MFAFGYDTTMTATHFRVLLEIRRTEILLPPQINDRKTTLHPNSAIFKHESRDHDRIMADSFLFLIQGPCGYQIHGLPWLDKVTYFT